jgi:hypothetical protein
MPIKFIDMFQKKVSAFIWDNKPPKVKYSTMINTIEEGGLKLQDLTCKINAIRLKWIKQIANKEYTSPWKNYLQSKYKGDINMIPFYQMNHNQIPLFIDNFYVNLFKTWCNIHLNEPENNEQICRQIIWHNSFIQVAGKPICYDIWRGNNIEFIQDIIDASGEIISREKLERKYNFQCRFMDYNSLKAAIPTSWKKKLKEKNK